MPEQMSNKLGERSGTVLERIENNDDDLISNISYNTTIKRVNDSSKVLSSRFTSIRGGQSDQDDVSIMRIDDNDGYSEYSMNDIARRESFGKLVIKPIVEHPNEEHDVYEEKKDGMLEA